MDFVCSLTGKSPSTTGAGSEGALTKGPFNALVPTTDLNNALLGFILTGYAGFTTAAGYIGHKYKVDHDISLMMPELWSRLSPEERDPEFTRIEARMAYHASLCGNLSRQIVRHTLSRVYRRHAQTRTTIYRRVCGRNRKY